MKTLKELFDNNVLWAKSKTDVDPTFFTSLSETQKPKYLWIGCADSRVPANEIVGLDAGDLFVHRNVSNLVLSTDLNCMSVIQYAVEVLKIEHIIICGHYQCGGISAAMGNKSFGLIDQWLMEIRKIYAEHDQSLKNILNTRDRIDRLCELNVMKQVQNLAHTAIIQKAWNVGQKLIIHGWIYNLKDGRLSDLGCSMSNRQEVNLIHKYEL